MSTGALTVTILPAAAVTLGAQWQVDVGAALNSGATASGLTVGNHAVTFTRIPGYTPAIPETVAIASGVTSTLTGVYIPTPVMQFKMTPYNPLLVGCANGCKISSAWYLAYNPIPKGSGPTETFQFGEFSLNSIQTFVDPGIYYYPSNPEGVTPPVTQPVPVPANPEGVTSVAQQGFPTLYVGGTELGGGVLGHFTTDASQSTNPAEFGQIPQPWLCISNDNSAPNAFIPVEELSPEAGPGGIAGICPSVNTFTTEQQLLPGKWLVLCVPAYNNSFAGATGPFGGVTPGGESGSTFIVNKPSPFGLSYPPPSGMLGALQIVDYGGNVVSTPNFTLQGLAFPASPIPQDEASPGGPWFAFDSCGVGFLFDGSERPDGLINPAFPNLFYIASITIKEGQFLKFNASAAVPNYIVMGVYQECTPCPGILPSTRL